MTREQVLGFVRDLLRAARRGDVDGAQTFYARPFARSPIAPSPSTTSR